ncbi:MAG: CHAT domain-containing protein [Leptospiraceae bacterium]|nr:CHAT domain-containing protein [Leptospiraceae bacterium]
MDILNIIVDRVEEVNVFNLIQGRTPGRDTHLHTRVDEDLLREFLSELERIAYLSNQMEEGGLALELNLARRLRSAGQTFFDQFFPAQIQEKLRSSEGGFLFFHVDQSLASLPWELLYEGTCFLADKFSIGKNIAGFWSESLRAERDRLRVLIIADPTEDLDWARREGEGLLESLNADVSSDRIDVELLTGPRLGKLELLEAIRDRDIIHYAGHLHYDPSQKESGWLLPEGKILRAREIEKVGSLPGLVFSNSCMSMPDHLQQEEYFGSETEGDEAGSEGRKFNHLAGAFLRAGIASYIGTSWEIRDSSRTFDFALQFYRSLFEERSVGEAMFDARKHARQQFPPNDMTWAAYNLHGNPLTRIFRSGNRRTFDASRNILTSRKILQQYPYPISRHYRRFLDLQESYDAASSEMLSTLSSCFFHTLGICGSILFSNLSSLKIRLSGLEHNLNFAEWTAEMFEGLNRVHSLGVELAAPGLVESFFLHRDNIEKLLKWSEPVQEESAADAYLVTFQYLFDNLLTDLSFLGRYRLVYLKDRAGDALELRGQDIIEMRILPSQMEDVQLARSIEKFSSQVCFFNSSRRALLTLSPYMRFEPEEKEFYYPLLDWSNQLQ